MNELKVFQNSEFGELSILLIDGKEYFPATQCAKILGYKNTRDAIARHCKGVVKHDGVSNTTNQHGVIAKQQTEINYIPEGDLYRLIIRSKLPSAEHFEHWVFDEVLPALRKNGSYGSVDLNKVVTEAVTMAVRETVKQLLPILNEQNSIQEDTRMRRLKQGKIAQLDPELRNLVDDMLLSRKYRYIDIKEFLHMHGVNISIAAIGKYKNTLYEVR